MNLEGPVDVDGPRSEGGVDDTHGACVDPATKYFNFNSNYLSFIVTYLNR